MYASAVRLDPRLESPAPSGWMLRDAVAAARDSLWAHPALKRLQDPGLGFDEFSATTLRLLLAYRQAEYALEHSLSRGIEGLAPYTPRTPMLERDLRGLGRAIPQPRVTRWHGASGRAAWLGVRCGLAEFESNADVVARRLWRFHPELWSNAASYWRYLRTLELKPAFDAALERRIEDTNELRAAARVASDTCRLISSYLSA
jgi:hypothetical protein